MTETTFHKELKRLQPLTSWTQEETSKALGVSLSTVKNWLAKTQTTPSPVAREAFIGILQERIQDNAKQARK